MSEFDQNLKLGDLTLAYRAGYHRIVRIERRFLTQDDLRFGVYKHKQVGDEYSSIIVYRTIITSSGKKSKGKTEHSCDASYCQKVTEKILSTARDVAIKQAKALYDTVEIELNSPWLNLP